MKTRHFAISQRGDSHAKSGTNCQDSSGTRSVVNDKLKLEMAVAAIADGVGSCDYSECGSKTAVETVLDMLGRELASLSELSDKTVLELLKKAFQQAYENIESEAAEKEIPFLLFDTTLTVAVLVEDGRCYVGHIGDDGIVALFADGSYCMITARIEGEEASSVVPLSSGEVNWRFDVAKQPVAALALITDGLLDKSVGSERMKNRVYYPFFKPMFQNIMENDQDENDLRAYWNDYLSNAETRSQYGITDDITLAVVQIPEILKKVHPVPFDEQKWNDETEEMRRKNEEALQSASSGTLPKTTQEPQPATPAGSANGRMSLSGFGDEGGDERPSGETSPTSGEGSRNGLVDQEQDPQTVPNLSDTTGCPSSDPNASPVPPPGPDACGKDGRVPHFPGFADGKQNAFGLLRRIRFPLLAVVCVAAIAMWSRNLGYRKGVQDGVTQERHATAGKMAELERERQAELDSWFEQGKQKGRDEVLAQTSRTMIVAGKTILPEMAPERFVIARGQKGVVVQAIQNMLVAHGASLVPDGDFGQKTALAVRFFQLQYNLHPTGEVDILTYWALMSSAESRPCFIGFPWACNPAGIP